LKKKQTLSKQQATLLNFKYTSATIAEWLKHVLSSVWTFRSMEKPLFASALKDGRHRRPVAIRLNNLGNLGSPSKIFIFLTSNQM